MLLLVVVVVMVILPHIMLRIWVWWNRTSWRVIHKSVVLSRMGCLGGMVKR
jgi:hypothetical protein